MLQGFSPGPFPLPGSLAPQRAREGAQHEAVHRGPEHGGAEQDGAGRREPEGKGERVPANLLAKTQAFFAVESSL